MLTQALSFVPDDGTLRETLSRIKQYEALYAVISEKTDHLVAAIEKGEDINDILNQITSYVTPIGSDVEKSLQSNFSIYDYRLYRLNELAFRAYLCSRSQSFEVDSFVNILKQWGNAIMCELQILKFKAELLQKAEDESCSCNHVFSHLLYHFDEVVRIIGTDNFSK